MMMKKKQKRYGLLSVELSNTLFNPVPFPAYISIEFTEKYTHEIIGVEWPR